MSASRDKDQKAAFVFSNLYQLFKNQPTTETKTEAKKPAQNFVPISGAPEQARSAAEHVLKVGLTRAQVVNRYQPAQLLGKRLELNEKKAQLLTPTPAVEGLKKNLEALNDLHKRLHFMLKELEELTSKE